MASMTVTARVVTLDSSSQEASSRRAWRLRTSVVAGCLSLLVSGGVLAQTAPPPLGTAPVEPLPGTQAPVAPAPPPSAAPAMAPAPYLASDPYAAPSGGDPLLAPPPAVDEPIYDKWWFWTAIGALAVVGVVIAVSASGSKTPNTYFGNGRAF